MPNLNDLEQDCYRRLGFATTTPDTATQTRIRAYLNETQQEILSEPGMGFLLEDSLTFATIASTPEYSLQWSVGEILQIRETTNRITLRPQSLDWYRSAYPDPTAVTGTPDSWVPMGGVAVLRQPTSSTALKAISTSASDGATKTVFVEGYALAADGLGVYFTTASATLNGITQVAIASFVTVTKFYIALTAGGTTTAVGSISLTNNAQATTYATIEVGQSQARYRRIALAVCPSAAITYSVDFVRDVSDMAQATDQPVIPVRFHRLLATGARMKEYEKQNDSRRYAQAQAEYLNGLRKLKHFVYSQSAGTPNLRGRWTGTDKASQLGAWFPAGS